jgi:hypothetical protein
MNRVERLPTTPLFAPVAPSLLHEKQFFLSLQTQKKHRASSEKQSKSSKLEKKSANSDQLQLH